MVVFQIWSLLVPKFRSFDPLHPFVPLLQQHNEYYTTITITLHWLQLPSPFFAMLLYGVYKGPGWVKFGIRYPTYPPFWDKSPFYEKKNFENIWKYHNQSQQLRYGLLVILSPLKLLPLLIVLLLVWHSLLFVTLAVWLMSDMWHPTNSGNSGNRLADKSWEKTREQLETWRTRNSLKDFAERCGYLQILFFFRFLQVFKLDSLLGLRKLWRNTNVNTSIIFTTTGRETWLLLINI